MGAEPDVIRFIEAGLEATSLRGRLIANNIANLNTAGYRRYAVDFEQVFADAVRASGADLSDVDIEPRQPRNTPVAANGNDVDLEMEFGEMIKNGVLKKTFTRMMANVYRRMDLAIQTRG